MTASQPARQAGRQHVQLNFSPAAALHAAWPLLQRTSKPSQAGFFVCLLLVFFAVPVPGRRLCPIDTALMAPHHPSINRLENISRSLLAEPSSGYEKNSGGQIRFK